MGGDGSGGSGRKVELAVVVLTGKGATAVVVCCSCCVGLIEELMGAAVVVVVDMWMVGSGGIFKPQKLTDSNEKHSFLYLVGAAALIRISNGWGKKFALGVLLASS